MAEVAPFCANSAGLCRSAEDLTVLLAERRQDSCLDDMEESEVIVGDESDDDSTDLKYSAQSCSEGVTAFNRELTESDCYQVYLHMDPQLLPPSDLYVASSHVRDQKQNNYSDYDSFRHYSLDNRLPLQLESLAEEDELEYTQEEFSASESEDESGSHESGDQKKDSASNSSLDELKKNSAFIPESEDIRQDAEFNLGIKDLIRDLECLGEPLDLKNDSAISCGSKDMERDPSFSQEFEHLEKDSEFSPEIKEMEKDSLNVFDNKFSEKDLALNCENKEVEENAVCGSGKLTLEKADQVTETSSTKECIDKRVTEISECRPQSSASIESRPDSNSKLSAKVTGSDKIIPHDKKQVNAEKERKSNSGAMKIQTALRSDSVQSTPKNQPRKSCENPRTYIHTSNRCSKPRNDMVPVKEAPPLHPAMKEIRAHKRSSDASVRSRNSKTTLSAAPSKGISLREASKEANLNSDKLLKETKKSVDTYGTLGRRNKLPSSQISKTLATKERLSTGKETTSSISPTVKTNSQVNIVKSRLKQSSGDGTTVKSVPCSSGQDQGTQADLEDPRCTSLLAHIDRLQKEAERSKLVISQRHQVQLELAETRRALQAEVSEKQLLHLQLERASERVSSLLKQLDSAETDSKQLLDQYELCQKQSQLEIDRLQLQLRLATDQLEKLIEENERSCSSQCLLLRQVQESEVESRELLEFMQMEKNALADALREAELKLVGVQNREGTCNDDKLSRIIKFPTSEKQNGGQINGDISADKKQATNQVQPLTEVQGSLLDGYATRISLLIDRLDHLANENHCTASRDPNNQSAPSASVEGRLSPDGAECQCSTGDLGDSDTFSTVCSRLEGLVHQFERLKNNSDVVKRCHGNQSDETNKEEEEEISSEKTQEKEAPLEMAKEGEATLQKMTEEEEATSVKMINHAIEVMTEAGKSVTDVTSLRQLLNQLKSFRGLSNHRSHTGISEEER